MPEETNGRATLRDIMDLQTLMNSKIDGVRTDMVELKIQSAKNTAFVSLVVSILTSVIVALVVTKFIGS